MNNWLRCELGDVITLKRGFDLPEQNRIHGNIPIISSSGITGFHNKSMVKAPGVVTGRYGTIGEVFYVTKDFWPLNTSLYVEDFKGNSIKFVSFFLKTYLSSSQNAAGAVPGVNRNHLHKIKIFLPPLSIQRKIAAILSAYDDLIENNNRRIALLEKMAEEIYKEWFVRMRFPGHEKVTFHKGVPEGWEEVKLENAFNIMGGGTPSKDIEKYWNNGDINWYTPSDITAASGLYLLESILKCNEDGLRDSSAKIFPPYSIMMTSRATIGALGINTTSACTNQGFITCIPNERFPLVFLYHWLKLNKSYFEILSNGSTFAELIKSTFKRIVILSPSKKIVNEYRTKVDPLFNLIEKLIKEVYLYKKTRDRLLSRLMSGKINVEELDILFPPQMEQNHA